MNAHSLVPLLLVAAVHALAACATTEFTSTWTSPDPQLVDYSGRKVAAIVVSPDESARRTGEDALAREISARGAVGVPAYTLLALDELRDHAAARTKLLAAGCTGAVVMRVTGKEHQVTEVPGSYAGPRYSSFTAYSRYGWSSVYDPTYLDTDTIVSVETLVYELEPDRLVWGGMSETFEPTDVEHFVVELAEAVVEQMQAEGLIR
jgi:hypothetical protein